MQKPAKMNLEKKDFDIVALIAKRAAATLNADHVNTLMDLSATHLNGCELDLQKLLQSDQRDFAHDIQGILLHLNRETGALANSFIPRAVK